MDQPSRQDGKMGTTPTGGPELRREINDPDYQKDLQKATDEVNKSADRLKSLSSSYEDEKKNIFQVGSFYIFALLGLTTLSFQFRTVLDSNIWTPLALSTVGAVFCFIRVSQHGMRIADLRGDRHYEENILKGAERTRSELQRVGTRHKIPKSSEPNPKRRSTCYYFTPYALILLFLSCFTLVVLISQWRILFSAHQQKV